MADLEERFFQKNVPGRYSSWNDGEDDNNARGGSDDDGSDGGHDFDDDRGNAARGSAVPPSGPSPATELCRMGGRRGGGRLPKAANTGAGAVAADYRAAREEGARLAALERDEREEAWDRAVHGGRMKPGEGSLSLAVRESLRRRRGDDGRREQSDGGSDAGDDEDEDDEFLEKYRARRLRQLQSASSLPTYGSVTEVTKFEFADAVDDTDPRTLLAVHMYDPSVRSCATLNHLLEDAARSMPHVRFVRLRASEAGMDLDPVGFPSLALYRGGELEHNLTPVTERLPANFDAEDVKELLEECGAGRLPDQGRLGGASLNAKCSGDRSCYSTVSGRNNPMMTAQPVVPCDYDSDDAELDELCRDFEPSCR